MTTEFVDNYMIVKQKDDMSDMMLFIAGRFPLFLFSRCGRLNQISGMCQEHVSADTLPDNV